MYEGTASSRWYKSLISYNATKLVTTDARRDSGFGQGLVQYYWKYCQLFCRWPIRIGIAGQCPIMIVIASNLAILIGIASKVAILIAIPILQYLSNTLAIP